MMYILWLVLVMGYGYFTWAAGNFSKAALSFLDGGYLAFLCFAVLPCAMDTVYFFYAAAAAGMGVLAGVFLEKKVKKISAFVFALVTASLLVFGDSGVFWEVLLLAFLGGVGLYYASSGVIPDKIEIGKSLLSGAGFLCGTLLFAFL